MNLGTFVAACVAVSAILAAGFGLARFALWCWTNGRRLARLIDDLTGEPGRPGMPDGRPGVLDRMYLLEQSLTRFDQLAAQVGVIEREMRPNGGSSLRDQVNVIVGALPPTTSEGGQEGQQLAA